MSSGFGSSNPITCFAVFITLCRGFSLAAVQTLYHSVIQFVRILSVVVLLNASRSFSESCACFRYFRKNSLWTFLTRLWVLNVQVKGLGKLNPRNFSLYYFATYVKGQVGYTSCSYSQSSISSLVFISFKDQAALLTAVCQTCHLKPVRCFIVSDQTKLQICIDKIR